MESPLKKETLVKFPILFAFAMSYKGSDQKDIRKLLRDTPRLLQGEAFWLKYERALQGLSEDERKRLLLRLNSSTTQWKKEEQGWPHFEEILNEALANNLLSNDGFKSQFIDDAGKGLKPDLEIINDTNCRIGLSEVKTIRFSDNEYKAVRKDFDTGEGRYLDSTTSPTLYKKIEGGVREAIRQMWEFDSSKSLKRTVILFLNLDRGNLLEIIFTPSSDLEEFICRLKKDCHEGKLSEEGDVVIEVKIYILAGGDPVELCS